MRRRHRFQPADPLAMEGRILLSGGVNADLISSTTAAQLVGGQTAGKPTLLGGQRRLADVVNQSFDDFSTDYLQAQAVYVADATNRQLFLQFQNERIDQLAQELVHSLARVPNTLKRLPSNARGDYGNSDTYLQAFLRTNIDGEFRNSLRRRLGTITRQNTAGTNANVLFTLSATGAIESARTNTLNAMRFANSGKFGLKHR